MDAYLPIAFLLAVAVLAACAPWGRPDPKSELVFGLLEGLPREGTGTTAEHGAKEGSRRAG